MIREVDTDPNKLVVVLLVSNLEYGGAQRQVVELANNLAPDSFDVHVFSLSEYVPLADKLEHRERRLHVIQKKSKFDFTVVPRLARALRSLRPDVLHSFLFDAEIAGRLAGKWAGVPLVVGSERNTDYHLKRRQLLAYRLTRNRVDLIIANSNAGAAFNRRITGQDPSRYAVIHNGVDTNTFTPGDAHAVRRELGIDDDEKVVGMFASFKAQKNHAMMFAVIRRAIERCPRTRFIFVGDELYGGLNRTNDYKQRMQEMVDRLGIRPHCLFLGNRPDVVNLYRACDLTVLPSLHEGTPNVALESMACGVPVVATNVSDNAQIIPDGQAGYIVPLAEEEAMAERICRLLLNEDLQKKMGRYARSWVETQFSTAQLARKTETAYLQALNRKKIDRRPHVLLVGHFRTADDPGGGISTFLANLQQSILSNTYRFVPFNTRRPSKRVPHHIRGYGALLEGGAWPALVNVVVTLYHILQFPFVVLGIRPKVIQIHSSSYWTFWESGCYVLMGRALCRPVILRYGGAAPAFWTDATWFGKLSMRLVLGCCNRVIVQSNVWHRFFSEWTDARKLVVLPNSVDVNEFGGIPRDYSKPRCTVLFLGGNEAQRKGLLDVLAIIEPLVQRVPGTIFHIIAEPNDVTAGVPDSVRQNVIVVRRVHGEERMNAFRNADVFVLPSYAEGFPNTLLEAMAAGLPIVVTPVGSVPEVVSEPRNGFIIEPGDRSALLERLVQLLENPELRERMGTANLEDIPNYQRDRVFQRLGEAYGQLV